MSLIDVIRMSLIGEIRISFIGETRMSLIGVITNEDVLVWCNKYRPTEPPVRTVFTVRITLPAPSLNPELSVISRSLNSAGQ